MAASGIGSPCVHAPRCSPSPGPATARAARQGSTYLLHLLTGHAGSRLQQWSQHRRAKHGTRRPAANTAPPTRARASMPRTPACAAPAPPLAGSGPAAVHARASEARPTRRFAPPANNRPLVRATHRTLPDWKRPAAARAAALSPLPCRTASAARWLGSRRRPVCGPASRRAASAGSHNAPPPGLGPSLWAPLPALLTPQPSVLTLRFLRSRRALPARPPARRTSRSQPRP